MLYSENIILISSSILMVIDTLFLRFDGILIIDYFYEDVKNLEINSSLFIRQF
jgi:hypothetical protein